MVLEKINISNLKSICSESNEDFLSKGNCRIPAAIYSESNEDFLSKGNCRIPGSAFIHQRPTAAS